jgi:hypothetical protein
MTGITDDPLAEKPALGRRVRERGGKISGEIVRAGKHPGEWQVLCDDGYEVTCLSENLIVVESRAGPPPLAIGGLNTSPAVTGVRI